MKLNKEQSELAASVIETLISRLIDKAGEDQSPETVKEAVYKPEQADVMTLAAFRAAARLYEKWNNDRLHELGSSSVHLSNWNNFAIAMAQAIQFDKDN